MGRSIKMGNHIIWITFFLAVQFSAVLGRNHFYEYYYSKHHHKNHSTTVAMSSSTTEIASEEKMDISVSGVDSLENLKHSSTGADSLENLKHSSTADIETTVHRNRTVFSYGITHRETDTSSVWVIFGIVLSVFFSAGLIICCCCCCCAKCCRRVKTGFVLSNNDPEETRVLPEQSLLNQALIPNYTEEPSQQYPTYYQSQTMQHPYCPPGQTLYLYNPASPAVPSTPPPPYDTPPFEAPPFRK